MWCWRLRYVHTHQHWVGDLWMFSSSLADLGLHPERRYYLGHNYTGHNYIGHGYIGHSYIGHRPSLTSASTLSAFAFYVSQNKTLKHSLKGLEASRSL